MNTSALTVEAWISGDVWAGANRAILTHDAGSGAQRAFQVEVSSAGKLFLNVWNTGGTLYTATGATTLSLTTAYHVVATYDGSTAKVYVNGIQDASVAATGTMRTSSALMWLGAENAGAGARVSNYNGILDEVAVYGTALSAARILAHYNAGTGITTVPGGQVSETDTALAGTVTVGKVIAGTQATETETALAGTVTLAITNPRQITGLRLWLSAEAETAWTNGQEMTSWADHSGLGNHAVATGTNAPIWAATGGPSSGEAVVWVGAAIGDDDAGGFEIPVSTWTSLTEAEIVYSIMAYNNTGTESGFSRFSESPNDPNVFYAYSDGSLHDHFASTTRKDFTPASISVDTWHRYSTASKAGEWTARFENVSKYTTATNTVSFPTTQSKSTLGYAAGTVEQLNFLGRMAAVLVYDHVLTAPERAAVDTWMAANPSGGLFDSVIFGGTATETDITLAGSTSIVIIGGQAIETDTALAGSVVTGVAGGMATETDTALAGATTQAFTITGGVASETDTALPGSASGEIIFTGGQATETDTALAGTVTAGAVVTGGIASETDTVLSGSTGAATAGGVASESDSALAGTVDVASAATPTWFASGPTVEDMLVNYIANSGQLKAMLCDSTFVFDKHTHEFRADVTGEVVGTGYTEGGAEIEDVAVALNTADNRVDITGTPVNFGVLTVTEVAQIVVYFSNGTETTDRILSVHDITPVALTADEFVFSWDSADDIGPATIGYVEYDA
jgi:hypothetical protein